MSFSHYPAIPPPRDLDLPVMPEESCPYFAERRSRYRAFRADRMPGSFYHQLMDAGFRRSGDVFYQPACCGCRECVPLRVPVAAFQPSKSQRRVWRENKELHVTMGKPDPNEEKFELYRKYVEHWHARQAPTETEFVEFLYVSPVRTIEFCYRDEAQRLLAVGICDLCEESLSSVYFYFDPEEAKRSLGTFGALAEISFARQRGIPFYYLGYWVEGCGAMKYKANFGPNEVLGTDGEWRVR